MINRKLLIRSIARSGVKKSFIASYLGITNQTLRLKTKGDYPFDENEIVLLIKILKTNIFVEVPNVESL